jgi:hypothetical protein
VSKVISASFTSRKTPGTADFRDETEARENEQADYLADRNAKFAARAALIDGDFRQPV